jgi:hypothetical protein
MKSGQLLTLCYHAFSGVLLHSDFVFSFMGKENIKGTTVLAAQKCSFLGIFSGSNKISLLFIQPYHVLWVVDFDLKSLVTFKDGPRERKRKQKHTHKNFSSLISHF